MKILPRILMCLSHEQPQIARALNASLQTPQRSLTLRVVPNRMISYRHFNPRKNNFVTDDLLHLQRNINNKGIITRLKRGKNTHSGCGRDDTKRHRERIEDHQQSAEKPCEWRSEGYPIGKKSYRQRTGDDLSTHHKYCQSIKSDSPTYLDKPESYNNCESSKHECCESEQATRIRSEKWTCGKPATESEIHYKCAPEPCTHSQSQEKTPCFPSSRDCREDRSKEIEIHPGRCPESEPAPSEKIILNKTSPVKQKISEEYPAPDTDEYYKPDPPPPRYPYWREQAPSYCDQDPKKTTRPIVKASPMIFFPKKEWRFRAKGSALLPQNIHEPSGKSPDEDVCGGTDVRAPHSRKGVSKKRCVISFEDKCSASLTIPGPVKTTESKIQQFPKLTKDGRCCVEKPEKRSVTSHISDCNPNMASFKTRLSKCPSIKEMWGTGVKPDLPVDDNAVQAALLSRCKKTKRPMSQTETTGRKKRKSKSQTPSNGWLRQKYKVRLKIFQKEGQRLDPDLPRIVEVRHQREEQMRPKQLKSAVSKGEFSSRTRDSYPCPCPCPNPCPSPCPSSCPSPHYLSEMPIAETKSYPTKMNESRVIREHPGKRTCKKSR